MSSQAGDLFRNPAGGLLLRLPKGKHRYINRGLELAAIIVDRVPGESIKLKSGKSDIIPAAHLNAMLQSTRFLRKFRPVDQITRTPLYLPDFSLTKARIQQRRTGIPHPLHGPEAQNSFLP